MPETETRTEDLFTRENAIKEWVSRRNLGQVLYVPRVFNRQFDFASGQETVSFIWPALRLSMLEHRATYDDAEKVLRADCAHMLGRAVDEENVLGITMTTGAYGVEFTVTFGPPWWWKARL